MKYTLIRRNRSLRTTSNQEFVSWMRKNDLQQWTDNQDFMKGYSKRKSTFEGLEIRFDNEQNFVNDLPTAHWWPDMFMATGMCGAKLPLVFGVGIPQWSLLGLLGLTLVFLWRCVRA